MINIFVVGRRYLRFRDCEELGGFLRGDPREVYQLGCDKRTVIGPIEPGTPWIKFAVKSASSKPICHTEISSLPQRILSYADMYVI